MPQSSHHSEQQCKDSRTVLNSNEPNVEVWPVRLEREPGLIMHFFDHVFPIQHPGYRQLMEDGGRGWYLSLMLSQKTLYHAVLCLSAYHREMTMKQRGKTSHQLTLQDLRTHNALSFTVLQQQLRRDAKLTNLNERIGMIAGITQMMFFQLLFFDDEQWKTHLEILTMMINDVYIDVLQLVNSTDLPPTECEELQAFIFFGGFLIWADLQSRISIGKGPRLSKLHDQMLKELPVPFQLQYFIGCESWVLQIISKIASIREWKTKQGILGKIEDLEIHRKSEQIKDSLTNGLSRIENTLQNMPTLSDQRSSVETTRIFALSATILLYITISGPRPDTMEVRTSVCRTIHSLKQLKDMNQLRVLPWALYVTGCMATGEDRQYILDLFNSLHTLFSGACSRDKYSQMLRRYWAAMETNSEFMLKLVEEYANS
ncbi:fungal-specific transcription factor domain-containing protein [Trichoderma evansii]